MGQYGGILSWVLIIGVFYVFLIMPERKKQKNMRSMLDNVKVGNRIITRGGIYGKIISLNDDSMVIESGPDNVRLEMSKFSISSVTESKNTEIEKVEPSEANENSEEKTE